MYVLCGFGVKPITYRIDFVSKAIVSCGFYGQQLKFRVGFAVKNERFVWTSSYHLAFRLDSK